MSAPSRVALHGISKTPQHVLELSFVDCQDEASRAAKLFLKLHTYIIRARSYDRSPSMFVLDVAVCRAGGLLEDHRIAGSKHYMCVMFLGNHHANIAHWYYMYMHSQQYSIKYMPMCLVNTGVEINPPPPRKCLSIGQYEYQYQLPKIAEDSEYAPVSRGVNCRRCRIKADIHSTN